MGRDAELALRLADKLTLTPEIVGCPFARCLRMMKAGQLDIMFGLLKYPEREAYMHFLNPPYFASTTRYLIYGHQSSLDIETLKELDGRLVGYLRGARLPDFFAQIETYEFTHTEELLQALDKKRVDYVLGLERSLDSAIKEKHFTHIAKTHLFIDYEVQGFAAVSRHSPFIEETSVLESALSALNEERAYRY